MYEEITQCFVFLLQIQSTEFIHCKEMVDEYLTSLEFSLPANAVYIFDSTKMTKLQNEVSWEPAGRPGLGQTRRGKGSQGEGDTDKFYDGFRCLYKEVLALEVSEDNNTEVPPRQNVPLPTPL